MSEAIKVLHVEDDADVAAAIRLLLRSAGIDVTSAGSVTEAMRCISSDQLRPDVLLLDYMLTGDETGADLAEHIARLLHHRVPTIILTGQLFNAEVPWIPGTPLMLAAKPLDGEMLIDTITQFGVWNQHALARQAAVTDGLHGAAA